MLIILTPNILSCLPVLEHSCYLYRDVGNTRVSFEMATVKASMRYLYRNKARKNLQRICLEAAGKPSACVAALLSNQGWMS